MCARCWLVPYIRSPDRQQAPRLVLTRPQNPNKTALKRRIKQRNGRQRRHRRQGWHLLIALVRICRSYTWVYAPRIPSEPSLYSLSLPWRFLAQRWIIGMKESAAAFCIEIGAPIGSSVRATAETRPCFLFQFHFSLTLTGRHISFATAHYYYYQWSMGWYHLLKSWILNTNTHLELIFCR